MVDRSRAGPSALSVDLSSGAPCLRPLPGSPLVYSSSCSATPPPTATGIERRDFIKKTGAGAASPPGFPGIISAQSVTNALKVGLVGAGGRGSGAAAQALSADTNTVLTAVADIDQAIVERAATRLKGSAGSARR